MTNDLIERLADRLFPCDCQICQARRTTQLAEDMRRKYMCKPTALPATRKAIQ